VARRVNGGVIWLLPGVIGASIYKGIGPHLVANSESNPYISKIASNRGEIGLNRMGKDSMG
jgi:hypothetical protein